MRLTSRLSSLAVWTVSTLPLTYAINDTASSPQLSTWWHDQGVFDFKGPIADGSVRQSHLYSIQIALASNQSTFFDSFVYESIPRNGIGANTDDSSFSETNAQDGITIEPLLNTTMAWTQFLYNEDVILKISRSKGFAAPASSANLTIRPTEYNYTMVPNGDSVFIHIPPIPEGTRFSIEFNDDLVDYHTMATSPGCVANPTTSGDCSYAQNVSNTWGNYYPTYNSSMPSVGVEPRNALLVFASPPPPEDLVANQDDPKTLVAKPGLVNDLDKTSASTVFFPPGVFYFSSIAHAVLAESVNWVYLSPGAYVKGALEFTASDASDITVSGFGVLSGEQYPYMANPTVKYISQKSDQDSLRMFRGVSGGSQHLAFTLTGITMANPPFNSMDFFNDTDSMSTLAWDYKQVGSWFDQTDGLENYPGSVVHDVFYHSSDDAIKLYHSNVSVANVVIWKKTNGPAIQLGWSPRNVSNIAVTNITQIHSRYYTNDPAGTTGDALIMSTVFPGDATDMNAADCSSNLFNVTISNLCAEGISPSLLRLSPLMNYDAFTISNVSIEQLSPIETGLQKSWARKWTDAMRDNAPVRFGNGSKGNIGVQIKDFVVGGEQVTFGAQNWNASSLGALDFDDFFWGTWSVE